MRLFHNVLWKISSKSEDKDGYVFYISCHFLILFWLACSQCYASYPSAELIQSDEIANYKNIKGTHTNEHAIHITELDQHKIKLLKPITIILKGEKYKVSTFSFFESTESGKSFKDWTKLKSTDLYFSPAHSYAPAKLYYTVGDPWNGLTYTGIEIQLEKGD